MINLSIGMLFFQIPQPTPTEPSADWTPFILLFGFLSPIVTAIATYLLTRPKSKAETDRQETETAILKINKLNELIQQVREVEIKFINLTREHTQLMADYMDFREEVARIFEMLNEIESDSLIPVKKHINMLKRDYPSLNTTMTVTDLTK